MSYMYWDWGKFKKHFLVFAAYLCILNVSVFNVAYLNGLFCRNIPVGTIAVLLSACAILLHVYNVLKFDYKWLSKTHKFQQVVTQLGLYLILCSIVFSVQLPQDISNFNVNKIGLYSSNISSSQLIEQPKFGSYVVSANYCDVNCTVYPYTPNWGVSEDYTSETGLISLSIKNTCDDITVYRIKSIFVVYADNSQQNVEKSFKTPVFDYFTLAPTAIQEFEVPIIINMKNKPMLCILLAHGYGITETVNIKLY